MRYKHIIDASVKITEIQLKQPIHHLRLLPSMENFHPLQCTPHHTDVLNSAHCCAGLGWTQHTRNYAKIIVSALDMFYRPFLLLQKIFTFTTLTNVDLSSAAFPVFFLHSFLIWPFSWPFWASFTSHTHKDSFVHREFWDPDVPSSAPYYARCTPKFLAQSCYYPRHIWHNMYCFAVWALATHTTSKVAINHQLLKVCQPEQILEKVTECAQFSVIMAFGTPSFHKLSI